MVKLRFNEEPFIFRNGPIEECIFFKDAHDYEFHDDFTSTSVVVDEKNREFLTENELNLHNRQLYIVLDTYSGINFGHFVWESLIFLKNLKRIHKKYPNVIFVFKNLTSFKTKILTYYGFKFSTEITSKLNFLGFFPYITALISNKYAYQYSELLDGFYNELHRDNSFYEKYLDIVYFHRHQKKDNTNFENMNRLSDVSEIENYVVSQKNSILCKSEDSDDWASEIDLVKRCRWLIVPDGSAYAVLGFHAFNSIIIVLGSEMSLSGMRRFEKVKYLNKKIKEKNEVYFVKGNNLNFTLKHLEPILRRDIVTF